jgi:hypothetical protein
MSLFPLFEAKMCRCVLPFNKGSCSVSGLTVNQLACIESQVLSLTLDLGATGVEFSVVRDEVRSKFTVVITQTCLGS